MLKNKIIYGDCLERYSSTYTGFKHDSVLDLFDLLPRLKRGVK